MVVTENDKTSTLYDMLSDTASRYPHQTAVVEGERHYSYERLIAEVSQLADSLSRHGVEIGDRVGIYLKNSWEAILSSMSVAKAGGVFVPISPLLKSIQVRRIIEDCGIKMLIAEEDLVRGLRLPTRVAVFTAGALRFGSPNADSRGPSPEKSSLSILSGSGSAHPTSDTVTAIFYTSGSTGRPKGVMLTHGNLVSGARIITNYLANRRSDRLLGVLPLNFSYGFGQFTTMAAVGGTLILCKTTLPGELIVALRKHRVTGLAGVPYHWRQLARARRSIIRNPLTHLRYITNAGYGMAQDQLDELRQLLPETDIFLMYGTTEALRCSFLAPRDIGRGARCIGKAVPESTVWLINDDGNECDPGELGEIVFKGPTVAKGYWGDKSATDAVFRPNPFAAESSDRSCRVVYTGDLARSDDDGFMYFVGRRDGRVKNRGFRVSPEEVEEVLCEVSYVNEAIAFDKSDEVMGLRIIAAVTINVQPSSGLAERIRGLCAARAPRHLVPDEILVVDTLPALPNGKIDRQAVIRRFG